MAGERFVNLIKQMSAPSEETTTDFVYGIVTSISPLKIKVDNRFEVDEKFLILSTMCKPMTITSLNHNHVISTHNTQSAGDTPHTHNIDSINTNNSLTSIQIWRGLAVDDKVRMLRVNNGQIFYVLEREEGIV